MRLGLDFDNTLISYDQLFRQAALDQGLIPASTPPQKNAVRDYLRQVGQEDAWTRLQGEVYGGRILEAAPYPGMREALRLLAARAVPMHIVSHKTRYPFLGEQHDLHAAARRWLEQEGFHAPDGLNWSPEQVFFELTKDAKAQRIVDLGCTHYVDDLPEILDLLPDQVEKILFSPDGIAQPKPGWRVMRAWSELPGLLGHV
ncbi:HAD family hydrolase [Massilia sp. TS11]|uniref:HAD family hydrolase n=1 Tax=Massilia sp. TS11 TaxID=2908003 RepID=UPI001EDA4C8C|nr:haloacid dehalogenase-like hydrolase [Massilia sp. TS11]MCG2586654.1 haloacid dehalogenase-like hydrolase [Massilia sp. TS11]